MLKVSKQAKTGISTRNEMFTRSTGNFNQRFHSPVFLKVLLTKSRNTNKKIIKSKKYSLIL